MHVNDPGVFEHVCWHRKSEKLHSSTSDEKENIRNKPKHFIHISHFPPLTIAEALNHLSVLLFFPYKSYHLYLFIYLSVLSLYLFRLLLLIFLSLPLPCFSPLPPLFTDAGSSVGGELEAFVTAAHERTI